MSKPALSPFDNILTRFNVNLYSSSHDKSTQYVATLEPYTSLIEVPQGLYLVPLFLFTFHQQIESPERTDLQDISAILSNACEEMIKEETLGLQFVL